jgi:aminoglycoside phosphotransferase (APT) family kinase protein
VPLVRGAPTTDYPFSWSICTWLPGEQLRADNADQNEAARDLAGFVRALRSIPTTGAPIRPSGGRGAPLAELDDHVRRSLTALGHRLDITAASRSWAESLEAADWAADPEWIHGDLMPGNLLVVDRRLFAVIDFGGLNGGDPACDLQPAWNFFFSGNPAGDSGPS